MSDPQQSRVFYRYTPQDFDVNYRFNTKRPFDGPTVTMTKDGPRGTVALKVDEDNGDILYGVSVCSADDEFNKGEGRKLALENLHKGFGRIPADTFKKRKFADDKEKCLFFLNNVTESVYFNMSKYKNRLTAFNKANKPKLHVVNSNESTMQSVK